MNIGPHKLNGKRSASGISRICMPMTLITQTELKKFLNYNPMTGEFTWRARGRGVRPGKVAGSHAVNGYLRIYVAGTFYQSHRLAWFHETGEWPKEDIDHINGIRDDNRFQNLRAVTRSVNLQNIRAARINNTTGLLGVQRNRKRFAARIQVGGKQYYLGTFDSPELAHEVYLQAKRKMHVGCMI